MDEKSEAFQPESQPEPVTSDSAEVKKQDQDKRSEKQPPSKFVRFLRKGLIGLSIVAAIFFAGFLTNHFVRYSPLSKELEQTKVELEQANLELDDLEQENARLTTANQDAENEIVALEEELIAARANMKFYQVLVDVNTARIELFLENIEGAQAALADTQDNLEDLQPFIEEVDADLALSLPRRLELIISGLARDPETGLIDLELFTKDLLELEPLLVVE
ncbi:hypothetical protein JR338_10630 [Chloroflexota bacterium]|nr:hypothetical protein JR338_10630 [Chloroflexota bacterium]